jgi:ABC-type branched-subunit amino acid transport system ATPase component/ABC-type branched-subunit amino acid transport system permease subunit
LRANLALTAGPVGLLRRRQLLGLVVVGVVSLVLALTLQDAFWQRVLTLVFLWTVANQSWNLSYGYAGQLSFGHSVFVGIGAYVFALLLRRYGVTPYLGLVPGMVAAAALAAFVGYPTFRLTGAYFALATIVLPLIAIVLVDSAGLQELTLPLTGTQGAAYMVFADPRGYSLLALVAMMVALVVVSWVDRSRGGYLLRAIRENQVLAEALGIDTVRWKLIAFAISAAMAAAFGVLWVESSLLVVSSNDVFSLAIVVQMISMCLIGGVGTRWGPLIGAAILLPLAETLNVNFGARVPGIQLLAYGVVLMLVILAAPEGLQAVAERWLRRLRAPSPPPAPTEAASVELVRSAPAGEPLLVLEEVSRSFGGVRAVHGVSAMVSGGQVVGIIGPNGAGKTTLLNLISGLYQPDAGRIRLAGRDVTRLTPHQRCRLGLGRTFQTPQLLGRLSVGDNVAVAALSRTRSVTEARRRAAAALSVVGLDEALERPAAGLTTLETKLVEVARALASSPCLLLMDESMSGLNHDEQQRLISLIRTLRGEGLTVVLIEHAIGSLLQVAERVIVLEEGELLAEGAGEEVMGDARVIEAYLGRKWRAKGPEPVG